MLAPDALVLTMPVSVSPLTPLTRGPACWGRVRSRVSLFWPVIVPVSVCACVCMSLCGCAWIGWILCL